MAEAIIQPSKSKRTVYERVNWSAWDSRFCDFAMQMWIKISVVYVHV